MHNPALPRVRSDTVEGQQFYDAVAERLQRIAGERKGHPKIEPIDTTGLSGTDLILANKINEIIARLQG